VSDFDPSTFASAEPEQFAKAVKAAGKDQLEAAMSGASRATILDEIFRRFPAQFRPDRAGGMSAVIHWIITGRPDGGADTYEVVVADGACTVSPAPEHEPKLAVTLGGVDFLNLIAGNANPMMMFMTGKLKAKGDLGLAANLEKIFNLPRG
jgi:SCP-2 sterol transfer family